MKNISISLLLVLFLSACNSEPEASKSKDNQLVNDLADAADGFNNSGGGADDALDLLDEEVNGFTYTPETLGVFDVAPAGAVSANYLNSSGEQISVVSSQLKIGANYDKLRIISANLHNGSKQILDTNIQERFHQIKKAVGSDYTYYALTLTPTKLYKVDVQGAQVDSLGELFVSSAILPNKRSVGFIHQNGNRLCGTLGQAQDLFFYKDLSENLHQFNYDQAEKPKYVYCLKDNAVLIYTPTEKIYTISEDGQAYLGGKSDLACEKTTVTYRNENAYFLCYYRNTANKLVYHAYLVNPNGGSWSIQTLPAAPPKAPAIPYTVKISNADSTDKTHPSILYYRAGTTGNWSERPIPTKATDKTIINMKSSEGELILLTQLAFLKYKDDILKKYPLTFTPKEIFEIDQKLLLTKTTALASLVDSSRDTNDTKQALLGNVAAEDLNPVPFLNAEAKLTAIKAAVSSEYIFNSIKLQSKEVIIRKTHIDDPNNHTDYMLGLSFNVIDLLPVDDKLYAVIKDAANKYHLKLYNFDLQELATHKLTNKYPQNSVLSVLGDKIFIHAKNELYIYNLSFAQLFMYPLAGFSSKKVVDMGNGHVLAVINSSLVKINKSTGQVSNLHSLSGKITADAIQLELIEKILYINVGSSRILKVALPTSEFI